MDDWTALQAYVKSGDERAFAVLVERHLGLVYGAARRQVKDCEAAQEVAQAVFARLAREGHRLKPRGSLAGWLYRVACGMAVDHIRAERARKRREREHVEMTMQGETEGSLSGGDLEAGLYWREVAPLLDEGMRSLRERDRVALLMRIFEERPLAEVGEALGLSEDAARKRVAAALERLRRWFERRGIACSSSALTLMLGHFAAPQPAAACMHLTITQALIQGATYSGVTHGMTSILTTTIFAMKTPMFIGFLVGAILPFSLATLQVNPEVSPVMRTTGMQAETDTSTVSLRSGIAAEWKRLMALHGPETGSMAALYEAVDAVEDGYRRLAMIDLAVSEWVANDPEGALDYFVEKGDRRRLKVVMERWLDRAPAAALAGWESSEHDLDGVIPDLLGAVAARAPAHLGDLAARVEAGSPVDRRVAEAFALAARGDLLLMREAAESMGGGARGQALAGVAEVWAESDPEEALRWAQTLAKDAGGGEALQGVLLGWARREPRKALDHLEVAPTGGGNPLFAGTQTAERVLEVAGETDFEATLRWLEDNANALGSGGAARGLKDPLRKRMENDLEGTLAMLRDHPAARVMGKALNSVLLNEGAGFQEDVWRWLRSQGQGSAVASLTEEVLMAASWHDPSNALTWAGELLGEESITLGGPDVLVERILGLGHHEHQWEGLIEDAPQNLRTSVVRAGVRHLSEGGDVAFWRAQLPALPEEEKPGATRQVAAAEAMEDPAEALRWADSLSGDERLSAYEGAVGAWARSDSYAASHWIGQLSSGPSRDHAVQALVDAVAAAEPDSAWRWALTVEDPKERMGALRTTLRHWGDFAYQAVSGAALPPEEKTELLQWLANRPQGD